MKKLSTKNQGWEKWMAGAALGAVAMYFADPDQGRRRRAVTRDKMNSMVHASAEARDVAMRDLTNRLEGARARIQRMLFIRSKTPDDQKLIARVRAQLGRAVSHPHAIQVAAQNGHIALSGPILAHEKPGLLKLVQGLRGVTGIDDRMEAHTNASGVAALQGPGRKAPMRTGWRHDNWTPASRGLATIGGGALGAYGLARRTPAGMALAAVGAALLARGVANQRLTQLIGVGPDARTIVLQKTIDIDAPPETVFDAWEKYENFPRFMSHVLAVQDLGNLRSHWIVHGPAGTRIEWHAVLTQHMRPHILAWESEPNAAFAHAGTIRLEPSEHGTRVTVRMSYRPPAGALGQMLAVLLGSDPKQKLDDDLMRMKNFIESGIAPHDAARPQSQSQSAVGQFFH